MPSRIIHIRLDDWVLLGCHDILKANDKAVDNIPMSTIAREVLTAFIRKMQQGEHIPTYSQEELIQRLKEIQASDINIPDIDMVDAFITDTEEDADMSALASKVLQEIATEGEPTGIMEDVTIGKSSPEDKTQSGVDIFQIDSKPFFTLKAKSPKDRFIEWAENEKNDILKKAVAIVYSNLPESQWGSEEAENNILSLVNSHLAFTEEGD